MSLPLGTKEPNSTTLAEGSFADVYNSLIDLDLPIDEYYLLGGANLVLRGIKYFTPDIDALVSEELFEELKAIPGASIKQPPASAVRNGAENTTVWVERDDLALPFSATTSLGDGYYPISYESHKDKIELVEGFPCILLEEVKKAKEALQRQKDIHDLAAIAVYLGEEPMPLPKPIILKPREIS